jgi:hypothetical protein
MKNKQGSWVIISDVHIPPLRLFVHTKQVDIFTILNKYLAGYNGHIIM